jgi:hypothetical protein
MQEERSIHQVNLKRLSYPDQVTYYCDKFADYLPQWREWKHFICQEDYLAFFKEQEEFIQSGFQCACTCSSVPKRHFHLIARWNGCERTLRRKLNRYRSLNNILVKQGSNFCYKFLNFRSFSHFLGTLLYLTRVVKRYDRSLKQTQEKHHDFYPFGNSKVSETNDMKVLWLHVHKELQHRFPEDLQDARREYEEYKIKKSLDMFSKDSRTSPLSRVLARKERDYAEGCGHPGVFVSYNGFLSRADFIKRWRETGHSISEPPFFIKPAHLEKSSGVIKETDRHISLPLDGSIPIVCGLPWTVAKMLLQKKDFSTPGSKQLWEVISSKAFIPETMDDGDD